MNNFSFTGNLGKDSEVKQAGASTLCSFSVAVKSGYGDKAKTTWLKCNLWGKRAEGALPGYLVKGAQVAIAGEFSMEEWDKDGVKHSMPVVNVQILDLIGGKQEAKQPSRDQQHTAQQEKEGQSQEQQAQPAGFDDFSDDIPF